MNEVLQFRCAADELIGVLCHAKAPQRDTAVLIIVGGPQYRAGSHRQFVQLAHALSMEGYPSLRFDHRGIGDSTGELRSFTDLSDDIAAALDALQHALPQCRRFVLWGLCDGASAALLYRAERPDPRVAGLCLLNPWVRSATSQARTQVNHYYRERLLSRQFWAKLLRGGVHFSALRHFFSALKTARTAPPEGRSENFQDRMARGLVGPVLLQLSDSDFTAREFMTYSESSVEWKQALAANPPDRNELVGADHTLSAMATRMEAERTMISWLISNWPTNHSSNSNQGPP